MLPLSDLELLCEGRNSLIYLQKDGPFGARVVVKVLRRQYPSVEHIVQFNNEHELTKDLRIEGLRRAFGHQRVDDRHVLFLEYFDGIALKEAFSPRVESLEEFLTIAASIAGTLSAIHAQGIVHRDINGSNILVHRGRGEIRIIDFGISTRIETRASHRCHPGRIEGTLAYMSPEQTGRTNRAVDHSTDLYSLGATLYEVLAGRLPFPSADPLELVHCHIAATPTALTDLAPSVPAAVEQIVHKLLAKNPEDRYLTAEGLRLDLVRSRDELRRTGAIEPFPLASGDSSERFRMSSRRYGRRQETEQLLSAYQRVAEGGPPQLVLVSGSAGVGKSSLVAEIHRPVVQRRGYFIGGKYDQLTRNSPYSGILQAFKEFVETLLTESPERLAHWRTVILDAVRMNAQVLVDVLPALELVLGPQPPVATLGITETKNRYNYVFQSFMRAICAQDHPLVVFIDDLQWADAASFQLLDVLLTDSDLSHVLFLGAYRDSEIDASHPLVAFRDGLAKQGTAMTDVRLANLPLADVQHLVADTLRRPLHEIAELAELVHTKTLGNPFFVGQFLRSLAEEGLLRYDRAAAKWTWNVAHIRSKNITDNVVELVARKLQKLPERTQHVLNLGASMGNTFDVATLAMVSGRSQSAIVEELWPALEEGLIVPVTENYRFVQASEARNEEVLEAAFRFLHDRVQQASYAQIPEERRAEVHVTIGRTLARRSGSAANDARIFEAADQLNAGSALITDPDERVSLAALNLRAGQRAKRSTAYRQARAYLRAGTDLLRPASWEQDYELSRDLFMERIEVEYLTGDLAVSEELGEKALSHVRTNIEKGRVFTLRLLQLCLQAKYRDALDMAGRGLAELIGFPTREQLPDAIAAERRQVEALLGDRSIASLVDDREMTDPVGLVSMGLLAGGSTAAYLADQQMMVWIVTRMVSLTLQLGRSPASSQGFVLFGTIMGSLWGDHRRGYEFGKLAYELAGKTNLGQLCKISHMFASNVCPWVIPLDDAYPIYDRAYQAGLDAGEWLYSGYACFSKTTARLYQGVPIDELFPDADRFLHFTRKVHNREVTNALVGLRMLMRNLGGRTSSAAAFDTEDVSEADFVRDCTAHTSFYGLCHFFAGKQFALYLYREFASALLAIAEAKKNVKVITGKFPNAVLNCYESLTHLALCDGATAEARAEHLRVVEENQRKLRAWADTCPVSYRHKAVLVEAERARVEGGDPRFGSGPLSSSVPDPGPLYDEAIELASRHGFSHEEALANELAGRHYRARGRRAFAEVYLKRAIYLYGLWGVRWKIERLGREVPELASLREAHPRLSGTRTELGEYAIDIASVMKAAQIMSQEVHLESLLEKMLKVLLENAGADQGALLQPTGGRLTLLASRRAGRTHVAATGEQELTADAAPLSVLNYVARTHSVLVVNDASADATYATDPYIASRRPRSVLCFPVVSQRELRCVLYFENSLTALAFDEVRIKVLEMLSSQVAISLENARLYDRLRQTNESLANALAKAEESARLKSQFLANTSHELRTPLNAIINLPQGLLAQFHEQPQMVCGECRGEFDIEEGEMVVDGAACPSCGAAALVRRAGWRCDGEPGEMRRHLQSVYEAGSHLLEVVSDIIDVSKLEAGQTSLVPHPVSAGEIVANALKVTQPLAEAQRITVEVHSSAAETKVVADRLRMTQVIVNLVGNAIKFSPEGSVVSVDIEVTPNEAIWRVSDQGIGIAPEHHDAIFESFRQVDGGDTRRFGGTGLGLAICKKLVELHGGSIGVESQTGRGATFFVRLPVRPVCKREGRAA
jgi:predicted ATPase/signal transduction histidine kinase